jgi:hypothetical protein
VREDRQTHPEAIKKRRKTKKRRELILIVDARKLQIKHLYLTYL